MDDNPWGAPTPSPRIETTKAAEFHITSLTTTLPSTKETGLEEELETIKLNNKVTTIPIEDNSIDVPIVEEVVIDAEGFTERTPERLPSRRVSIVAELPPMDPFNSPAHELNSFNIPTSSTSIPESIEDLPVAETETIEEDGFDDFADFGEGDEDGDDFGSFGGDEDEFNVPLSSFSDSTNGFIEPEVPIASTSSVKYTTLNLSNPTIEGLRPQLTPFLEILYPFCGNALTDEHERQVDGIAQVLVTERLRSLLVDLSSLPPLKPLDWRRSRIRREHLITLGVPINLDDSPDAKPLASLILPSQIRRSASPSTRSPILSSPSTTISNRLTTSPLPSRSTTPNPTTASPSTYRSPLNPASEPPPLNTTRAKEICDYIELDLSLFSLEKLRGLKQEMEEFGKSVSDRLEYELRSREKEVGDGEAYHAMITDLVSAASKLKTTGRAGSSLSRTGSGSGKGWGRKTSK